LCVSHHDASRLRSKPFNHRADWEGTVRVKD
jgi:hypothetical protein